MRATGIVRRIDDLGRVVIPKELRRTMKIRNGEPLEIYLDRDGEVILKKYSPINDLGKFAQGYADSLHEVLGHVVCVTDMDEIIAVSGWSKKELLKKSISDKLGQTINTKQTTTLEEEHNLADDERVGFKRSIVAPIILDQGVIGSVIITSKNDSPLGELELKLAETAASFLAKQMME
ncbi:MAG: stage V sporulation protein T [Peptococcaceae bacterium BRH_c8a]|nr:MAG: stage V sporulation protein T [Peptococcaceae bacterium BRH_c8a]